MKLDNPQLQQLLAGEYVLGTLQGLARQRFEQALRDNSALRGEVNFWEQALAPLAQAEQAPARDLLPAISRRLGWEAAKPARRFGLDWLPALAFATVAGISILLWAPWQDRFSEDFVVTLAMEQGTARWQLAIDKRHDWIDLQVVDVPSIKASEDLELWLLVDGGNPISLGLVPEARGTRQRIQSTVSLSQGNGLAISVEPAGGSPTGGPTGPVIAAQMFPTA